MKTAPFELTHFIPYLLNTCGQRVSDSVSDVYKDVMTTPQWRIMCHLYPEQGFTSAQLCALANLDKSTASRAIKELQQKGWLHSSVCKKDKRAKQLQLTSAGIDVFAGLLPQAQSWQNDLLAGLSDAQVEAFVTCLQALSSKAQEIKKAHQ